MPERPDNGSRRPTAGSRAPISRPRRVAGTGAVARFPITEESTAEEIPAGETPAGETPVGEPEVADSGIEEAPVQEASTEKAPPERAAPEKTRLPRSPRTVGALVAAIVVLLGVGTWEAVTIAQHESPEDRPVGAVSAERPVQVDELTVRSVVDQAAQAAVAIGSASWEDYEAGVDAATAMMTDPFAEQYRETKADVKDQVVEQQVDVTVQVDAQGVVRADRSEIVALVFLTQSTIAGTGPVTPRQYRASVTMVNTADGWLVADLDAGDLLDITGDDG